jgi:euchromatic histone-lysine N-methyltransferase
MIHKGDFVCEYVGELITQAEADRRVALCPDVDNYLFCLPTRGASGKGTAGFSASVCVIDAYAIRNVAPFINFSCEPNLESRKSFAASGDARLPRVTFYAKRDIYVGEELGYRRDPSATSSKQRNKTIACRCGATVCNKGV